MANTNDVIVAAIGLAAAIVGGGFAANHISKKGKNKAKITQGGIGKVSNNATLNQTVTNEGNERAGSN